MRSAAVVVACLWALGLPMCGARLLDHTTSAISSSSSIVRQDMVTDGGNTSETPSMEPSLAPTLSVAPTINNATSSPAPSLSPSIAPTLAPIVGTLAPTVAKAATTAPTQATAATTAPSSAPAAPEHRMSFFRFIEKTIALCIMLVLSLLAFGAIMNNRYRIYFFMRGVWYTILGMQCTRWVMQKLRLGGDYQPVDQGLNTVIFENEMDQGLLMREAD